MWRKFFKKESLVTVIEEEEEVLVAEVIREEEDVLINSKTIQEDIHRSFKEVLAMYGLNVSKESEIEDLKKQVEDYRLANMELYDKITKLTSVGLTSTPSVKLRLNQLKRDEERIHNKVEKIQGEIDRNERVKSLVDKYSEQYPDYKFVTAEVMIDIMKKYTLVMGESSLYAKEVPEESLEIISRFSEEIQESVKKYEFKERVYRGEHTGFSIEEVKEPVKINFDSMHWHLQPAAYIADFKYGYSNKTVSNFTTSKFKMVAPQNHFKIPEVDMEKRNYDGRPTIIPVPIFKLNEDTRTYDVNTRAFEEILEHNRKVLDPIACLEVEGGYIIMTAWDEEADIPEIQK